MFELDISIFNHLHSLAEKWNVPDLLIIFLAEGVAYILLGAILMYLIYSALSRHHKVKALVTLITASSLSSLLITKIIQHLSERPRPYLSLQMTELISETSYSFPSAHAAIFFALSTVIFFYNKKVGILFGVATIFICIGRMLAAVHYPSDVIAGFFVGVVSGIVMHSLSHAVIHKKLFTTR